MHIPIKQFRQSLIDCAIVTEPVLAAFERSQTDGQACESQPFAARLVEQGLLTKFQAKFLLKGKARALVLGNYVIATKLGEGGMGAVFKARHTRMKREVAIKLLLDSMLKSAEAVTRFQREVEAAAKLEHQNVVAAYDADEDSGRHFLVMQYVDGSDLAKIVRRHGQLPLANALDFLLQAAAGLEYAHGQGVVHRDIKPANLMLSKTGEIKVLDLGLARIGVNQADEHQQPSLTETGMLMGTVDYMAPEQALDTKHADERSDIYSLGCTLYFLLTGRPMFERDTLVKTILAHREEPAPALCTERPDTPAEVEEVFARMVAKDPAARYQSMGHLAAALQRLTENSITKTNSLTQAFSYKSPTSSASQLPAVTTLAITQAPSRSGRGLILAGVIAAVFFAVAAASISILLTTADPAPGIARQPSPATPPVAGAPKPEYASIATGVWQPAFKDAPPVIREGVEYTDGVLKLTDTILTLSQFHGRDFIIRTDLEPVAEAHTLHLRSDSDTNLVNRAGRFYGGWLNHNYFRRGIGFSDYGGWDDLSNTSLPDVDPVLVDGRLELAFSAVGDKMTLYINGKLVAEATTSDLRPGYVRIGTRNGTASFRNIQVMPLDKEQPEK